MIILQKILKKECEILENVCVTEIKLNFFPITLATTYYRWYTADSEKFYVSIFVTRCLKFCKTDLKDAKKSLREYC